MRISVVVNTKNEERSLDRCLQSAAWADEIIVVDMQSADRTCEIARRHTDKVFTCPDYGYVEPARNESIAHATGDWVFILDADEVIPPRLAAHVRKLVAETEDSVALIAIPRHNYVGDYLIRNSGWGADYQPRLFRRGRVRWTDTLHAWPESDGEVKHLDLAGGLYIKHYNYRDLTDFIARLNRYTSVEAARAADGELPGWQTILREVSEEFGRHYTPREDGFYSLALAGCMAFYRFVAHCKRLEQVRAAEGELLLPLPDSLAEIAAEALKQLPQGLAHVRPDPQLQEAYEAQLRARAEELTEMRAGYETQIGRMAEELARAREVYEAQLAHLTDELTTARAVYETQIATHEAHIAAQAAQHAADEARIVQLADELRAARAQAAEQAARLADREAQLEQQTAHLVKLRAQADRKDEALDWIYTSRSWHVASKLRRMLDLKHRWRQYGFTLGRSLRLPLQPLFYGLVESPTEAAHVAGELEIEGWVFSTVAAVVRVEAFIDDFYLGRLNYGLKRADVAAAYPAQARVNCGYGDRVKLEAAMTGHRRLIIRAYDEQGHVQIYTRAIVVGSSKSVLQPVKPRTANGNGTRKGATAEVFAQAASTNGGDPSFYRQVEALVEEFKGRAEREPSVLNWNTGLNLAATLPQLAVFSPPAANGHFGLPYLDRSVDIVVLPAGDERHLAEAHRVASIAVVQVHGAHATKSNGNGARSVRERIRLATEWKESAGAEAALPTTSIIIPVHNNVAYTERCLEQVLQTLPHSFRGEIIVVDDASTDETPTALARWVASEERIRVLRNEQNTGFIVSCNRGAEAAHGEILVFLNNDTLPQAGWLAPLLRVLRERADAGAVGGKLLYPDGTLQEAGGIIFADATGCNFGRNDKSPDAPLYNFLREVDYCSGALLATPRALFLSLGGFDTRYAPAYYEDTDYCFALRAAGRKVYYQPESVVIHFEGVTAGTDVRNGIKSYQAINRLKFMEKWRDALQRQPAAPSQYNFNTLHALSVRAEVRDGGD